MVITKKLNTIIAVLLLGSISIFGFSSTACNSEQAIEDSPQPDPKDKGLSKMDSRLNQLVKAEERGEADLYAERSNIKLVDGSVRVIIECIPGQLESASGTVTSAGAKLETSYKNLLQVLMPLDKLTALADAESIRFIRLPQEPALAPSSQE